MTKLGFLDILKLPEAAFERFFRQPQKSRRNNFANFLYLDENMSLFGYQISKDSPQMPLGTLASQKAVNFSPRYKFSCQ